MSLEMVNPVPPFDTQNGNNDIAELESEVMDVAPHLPDPVTAPPAPTRWVYRGFNLRDSVTRVVNPGTPITLQQREMAIRQELTNGFVNCPIILEGRILGMSDAQILPLFDSARNNQLAVMRAHANASVEIEGFHLFPAISDHELLAIAHVGGFLDASVSTGSFFEVARAFSIGNSPPAAGTDSYILAAEIAFPPTNPPPPPDVIGEFGIEYVTADFTLPDGRRPLLQLNSAEGSEVTFLKRMRFIRAFLHKIEPGPVPGSIRVLNTTAFP